MYIPRHFEVSDRDMAMDFIRANAFGQLISTVEGRLFSSHLPFMIKNGDESLVCHTARRNPQWRELEGQEVLVSFQGPHDYISPSWYESPRFKASMLTAIVGVEIAIREVQCKYKLSQNRPNVDRRRVIDQLKEGGSTRLSQAMLNELNTTDA